MECRFLEDRTYRVGQFARHDLEGLRQRSTTHRGEFDQRGTAVVRVGPALAQLGCLETIDDLAGATPGDTELFRDVVDPTCSQLRYYIQNFDSA